jgi:glycosyltransferase involved in cell wall biosynthesis
MRVAVVHEWLVDYSGSERVLEQMLKIFPDADLFAVVEFLPSNLRFFIRNKPVKTSFIQRLPFAQKKYRTYLPLMPLAVEQFDVSEYDLVISSSHAVAKGILTGPDQLHICMCYSPIRYAWDLQHQYLKESGLTKGLKGWIAKAILHYMRIWDYRTASGVDKFIGISNFIVRRIKKSYGREATVIYPPVDVEHFTCCEKKEDFYLTTSRMVPYKRIDLIVDAFTAMPERKLIVIGDGPDFQKVKAKAGHNITFMGFLPFEKLRDHMQCARAFVFAAEEDFGIAPLEAQACGTPVIAYGKGGVLETVCGLDKENPTGIFFPEQTVASLIDAVCRFEQESDRFNPLVCRQNAVRFSPDRFRGEFSAFVEKEWEIFQARLK